MTRKTGADGAGLDAESLDYYSANVAKFAEFADGLELEPRLLRSMDALPAGARAGTRLRGDATSSGAISTLSSGGPGAFKVTLVKHHFGICLLILAACDVRQPPQTSDREEYVWVEMYRPLNVLSEITCSGKDGIALCGGRIYSRPKNPNYETGRPDAERDWEDCSSEEFNCISNSAYLLAVPRTELQQGQTYRTHGSELIAERCFPSLIDVQDTCEVALISSRCVEDCTCLGDTPDRGVLFYYSRQFGVTAFFLTNSIKDMREALPVHSWTLVADEGFLKKQMSLPKADGRKPCSQDS